MRVLGTDSFAWTVEPPLRQAASRGRRVAGPAVQATLCTPRGGASKRRVGHLGARPTPRASYQTPDWTSSPLAALWFAVRDPAEGNEAGLVLALVPGSADYVDRDSDLTPYGVPRTLFFQPTHLSPRIVAQGGWFSVHKWNVKLSRFSTLERLVAYKRRIRRIRIPANCFADLRWELDRMAVNESSLFPDLDGMARHLNWSVSLSEDESS
jgi:hypothetical protein